MKQLLRRVSLILSSLFLLVSLITWIRSYFVSDQLLYTTQKPVIIGFAYGQGTIDFVHITFDPSVFIETTDSFATQMPKAGWQLLRCKPDERDDWQLAPPEHELRFIGAKYRSGKVLFCYAQDITLRFWMLALIFALYPAIRLVRHRRRRPGQCLACGYDIRATPQRCPECGHRRESLMQS